MSIFYNTSSHESQSNSIIDVVYQIRLGSGKGQGFCIIEIVSVVVTGMGTLSVGDQCVESIEGCE